MAEEYIAQLEAQAEQLQLRNPRLLLNNQEILNAMQRMQEQLRLLGENGQGQGTSSAAPTYSLKVPKPKAPEEFNQLRRRMWIRGYSIVNNTSRCTILLRNWIKSVLQLLIYVE